MVSDEVPLWHFSDFNMGKFERYPKAGKPCLYSWVMNNYWFTNFRTFQEGTVSWTYTVATTRDTTISAATKFAWGVRNPLPTRTFPAREDELKAQVFKSVQMEGDKNVMLLSSRPSFNGRESILLHFRELDGLPAKIYLVNHLDFCFQVPQIIFSLCCRRIP